MPLDSRDKRASSIGEGLASLTEWPAPDGTPDAPDRLHLAGYYRGITAEEDVVPDFEGRPTATAAVFGGRFATVTVHNRPRATVET